MLAVFFESLPLRCTSKALLATEFEVPNAFVFPFAEFGSCFVCSHLSSPPL